MTANNIDNIPESMNGEMLILFSTEKEIYLTDSLGSFISTLYSVEDNIIRSITSNTLKDTIYFLQSSDLNSPANVMMTPVNDFNPIVVANFPFVMADINKFMFKNGIFYFLNDNSLYKFNNNTITSTISGTQCFDVSNDGTVNSQNANTLSITGLTNNVQGSAITKAFDMDYIDSENTIYAYEKYTQTYNYGSFTNYLRIRKYNIDNDNYSSSYIFSNSIYNPYSGLNNVHGNRYESVIKSEGDILFFNIEQNLYSIPTDQTSAHPFLIKTTPNGKNINGFIVNLNPL